MAHKATLKIDNVNFEVLHCSYSFHQHVNPHTNETTSEIFGGNIDLTVATRKDDTMGNGNTIIKLMLSPHHDSSEGMVEFFNQKGESIRQIGFKDAAVVNFTETFSLSGDNAGVQSFTISSRSLDINGTPLKLKRE
ncbi:MAG: type VI secretion system tube protein TssD [Dyadobacter sp.]|uniref:type VI secretion system tube protein TssD n=1 Tax=Dyadobacter sp. TaxID=1914288 RepID=UPI0032636E8F